MQVKAVKFSDLNQFSDLKKSSLILKKKSKFSDLKNFKNV